MSFKSDVNAKNRLKISHLHSSTVQGHLDAATTILNNGATVNIVDDNNQTSLYEAVECDQCGVVKELPDNKNHVNVKGKTENSPLHLASFNGYKDVVRLLLNNGADVNTVDDNNGCTPSHWVVFKGHRGAGNMLLNKSAYINIVNDNNQIAFHVTAEGGHCGVIEELLNKKHQC